LNLKNLAFAKACGGILVNYCWKEEDARNSYQLAQQYGLPPAQVYFGVDVWAQNKSSFTHPRVTYPEFRGGGTHTGIAVDKLAQIGLSAGIFAPAWSFEHFPTHSYAVECAMWDGSSLPADITCSCGDAKVYHPSNRSSYITSSARQYPAGSNRFFYTDFNRGFGGHSTEASKRIYGGKTMHACLSSQSVLPHIAMTSVRGRDVDNDGVNILSQRLEDVMGESHLAIEAQSVSTVDDMGTQTYESWIPLFKFAMPADGSLQLTLSYKGLLQSPTASTSFYLQSTNGTRFLTIERISDRQLHCTSACLGEEENGHTQFQELGVHVRAPRFGQQITRILEVHKIGIVPRIADSVPYHFSLDNVRLERQGEGEAEHRRLSWTYHDRRERGARVPGMPYSEITGPFSYFVVNIDSMELGRVYALECIVPKSLAKELSGTDREVGVTGFGFDGKKLAQINMKLELE
jgi:hypothetical protein